MVLTKKGQLWKFLFPDFSQLLWPKIRGEVGAKSSFSAVLLQFYYQIFLKFGKNSANFSKIISCWGLCIWDGKKGEKRKISRICTNRHKKCILAVLKS